MARKHPKTTPKQPSDADTSSSEKRPTDMAHNPVESNIADTTDAASTPDTPATNESAFSHEDVLACDSGYVVVGKIGKSFGLQGMVFVHSYTDPKENLFQYPSLFLGNKDPICFSRYQTHAKQLVAQIDGTPDCDAAKRLTNKLVYLHTQQLPKLKDGEYYWHELTGLMVRSTTGRLFGKIDYLYAGGQFPIMVIKQHDNPRKPEILIPYEPSVVQSVDLEASEMVVDWDTDI